MRFLVALFACLGFAQSARPDKEVFSAHAIDSVEPEISPRFFLSLDTLLYPLYLKWEEEREVNYRKGSFLGDDDKPLL